MKLLFGAIIVGFLLLNIVSAIDSPILYEQLSDGSSQAVTIVPSSRNPIPRTVTLNFVPTEPFDQVFVDASALASGDSQNNVLADCTTDTCTVDNLELATNKDRLIIYAKYVKNSITTTKSKTMTFSVDNQGPSITGISINDCSQDCYLGTGTNKIIVDITDDSGINPNNVPLTFGSRSSIIPYECDSNSCYYNIEGVTCVEGSTVPIILSTRVTDSLGNKISVPYTESFECDPNAPIILDPPRVLNEAGPTVLYEGVEIHIKATIQDISKTKMTVDFTHIDGVKKTVDCQDAGAKKQQCEIRIYSPPGPKEDVAKISFVDAANNEIITEMPVQIYALNVAATPVITLNSVSDKKSVSRMFMTTAAQRSNFLINYPLKFTFTPEIITDDGGKAKVQVSYIELERCGGGIVAESKLVSETSTNNRVDLKLKPSFSGSSAKINCTFNVYLKSGPKENLIYYSNPGVLSVSSSVDITGVDFFSPGDQVVKKIKEREKDDEFYRIIEYLNNILPTLRTMCSVSNAVGDGNVLGAATESVGLVIEPFDGGTTLKIGQTVADTLYKVSRVLSTAAKDKQNSKKVTEQLTDNAGTTQTAAQNVEKYSDSKNIGNKALGFMESACEYISCENAITDRGSLTDSDSISGDFDIAWDQLSKPNVRDNLYYAIEQKCYPAVIGNFNELAQIHCGTTLCMKQMSSYGLDLTSCEELGAEKTCKKLLGVGTETIAYEMVKSGGTVGTVGNIVLAIKNLRARFVSIGFNMALNVINREFIEGVVEGCDKTKDEPVFSKKKIFACHIPFAIRLYIKGTEKNMNVNEVFGGNTNLCDLASCEGADCADIIPTFSNEEIWKTNLGQGGYGVLTSTIDQAKFDKLNKENIAKVLLDGSNKLYVPVGKNNDRGVYVRSDTWKGIDSEKQSAFQQFANGNMEGSTYSSPYYDNLNFESNHPIPMEEQGLDYSTEPNLLGFKNIPTPEYNDYNKLIAKQSDDPNSEVVIMDDDPNLYLPANNIDESYNSEFRMDKDGNIIAYDNNKKEWRKAWNPDKPGSSFDIYRQVGSKIVNQLLETYVFGKWKGQIQDAIGEKIDLYDDYEEEVCKIAFKTPPIKKTGILEITETGLKQFNFNAERWYDEDTETWYYTLIYFISGFNDYEEGYNVKIYLKEGDNKLELRKFKVLPRDVYRPDINDPHYRSVRAFNNSKKYSELCFEFDHNIKENVNKICKLISGEGFAGLGNPYVEGEIVGSGRTINEDDEGWLT